MAHKFELTQEELKAYVDLGAKLNGEFFFCWVATVGIGH